MAYAHTTVVRNTFIVVLEDAEAESDTFRRQCSDPLPRPSFADARNDGDACVSPQHELCGKTKALRSPRTSVGCDDSDYLSQDEWSPIDTPVVSPRVESSNSPWAGRLLQQQHQCFQKPTSPQLLALPSEWQGKTSVMIRNISYQCNRLMFCGELDKAGFQGQYDYVYLPINVGRGTSKGYGFANFVDDRTAYRFKELFNGRKMDVPGQFKQLEVIPANLQGYSQNSSHYITKQRELCSDSSVAQVQSSQVTRKSKEEKQSSTPHLMPSSCHQCHRDVPACARFCQWCGVGL
eukprot:TRINITY_DN420_c0_g1_i7.p1 TRINITY_DN420_c0_g1~~TRINITY_DN420_c0_g1_i7.p1  ORF type:complete len:292 (+),score=26.15 TRINITY_DN420_c0_g1_i7:67-942(+)